MSQIRIANHSDRHLWDQVLLKSGENTHFYGWQWREIISSVFKHKPYYLILEDQNGPQAICPLFLVKSFLFGTALISCPYINGGGIISLKQDFIPMLIDFIENLQKELGCKYTELRHRDAVKELSGEKLSDEKKDIQVRSHKVAMQLKLENDPEKLFSSFPPKLRSQIRRPTKEGCTAISIKGNQVSNKQLNDFYSVFSDNMKELGTPVYSKNLFSESLKNFGSDSEITIVYHNSKPVACGFTIRSGNYIEIPWAASLRSKSQFAPNMLLYWEILKNACLSGAEIFDFGRSSKNAGTFKFKAQWGAKPEELHWYYLGGKNQIPDINPKNEKFELIIKIWKKLPLSITKLVGPTLTKSLP